MQVKCESCGCDFYMSSKCKTKHPKCIYCRIGMTPEEARENHEYDWCIGTWVQDTTGQSLAKPNADVVIAWATEQEIEADRQQEEAELFFFGPTPSSDK